MTTMDTLNRVIDSYDVDKNSLKSSLLKSKERSHKRFGSVDPVIRVNKGGKSKVYFSKNKVDVKGSQLVKLADKLEKRVSKVQQQIKADYNSVKDKYK